MAKEEYRGYSIYLDMKSGEVQCPGLGLKAETIKELKTLINAELKQETVKYPPVQAFMLNYGEDEAEEVTVTRPAPASYGGVYVWVSRKGGKRSKENIDKLYAFECKDKLLANLDQCKELQRQVNELDKARSKLPRVKAPVAKA